MHRGHLLNCLPCLYYVFSLWLIRSTYVVEMGTGAGPLRPALGVCPSQRSAQAMLAQPRKGRRRQSGAKPAARETHDAWREVHEEIGQRLPAEKPCSHLLVTGAKQSAGGGDEPHRRKLEATSHPRTELRLEWNGRGKNQKPQAGAGVWGIGRQRLHQSQTSEDKMEKIFRKIDMISGEQRGNFYIFSLS
jgi:hypothetical protein